MNAHNPLGMVSVFPSKIQLSNETVRADALARDIAPQPDAVSDDPKDYFVERDGMRFAGTHLLVDLWGAANLADPELIDRACRDAAVAAGATILHSHFHHFSPNGGVSGVVVLAESHISIHTWPERDFAAVDIFMCGACDPYLSIPLLEKAFTPASVEVQEQRRGRVS